MDNGNVVTLLSVKLDTDTGIYDVNIAQGSNVAETAFSVSVIIKCFVRDGIIKNAEEFTDLLNKYLTDSQYNEVNKDEQL